MRPITFYIIILLIASCDYGYYANGIVVDSETNKPIERARVYSTDFPRFDELTDSSGNYNITFIAGPHQPVAAATIEKDGYLKTEVKDVFKTEGIIKLTKINPPDFDTVYEFVEKMPEFIGGQQELLLYITKSFVYPTQEELQMSFTASVIIDTAGRVADPQIIKPRYPDKLTPAEEVYLRVIRNMPAWIPGEHNGKKVNVKMVLPFKF